MGPPAGARPERWLLVAFVMRLGVGEEAAHEVVSEVLGRPEHRREWVTLESSRVVLRELEAAATARLRSTT